MSNAIHEFRNKLKDDGYPAFNYNDYLKMLDIPQYVPTYDELCCIFIYLYDIRHKLENAKEV